MVLRRVEQGFFFNILLNFCHIRGFYKDLHCPPSVKNEEKPYSTCLNINITSASSVKIHIHISDYDTYFNPFRQKTSQKPGFGYIPDPSLHATTQNSPQRAIKCCDN